MIGTRQQAPAEPGELPCQNRPDKEKKVSDSPG
jgi:hypothetical protein